MKIPGSDGNDTKLKKLKDGVSADRSTSGQGLKAGLNKTEDGRPANKVLLPDDSVKVSSLGSLLRNELDPSRMAEERRQKIEALKAQIKDGTYNPSSESVAAALSQELSFEILLAGDESGENGGI